MAAFVFALLLSLPANGAITNFQSSAWDNDIPHIYRNGQAVTPSGQASVQVQPDGVPYFYTQEIYENIGLAISGAGAGNPATNNPQMYQHVFAYTLPNVTQPFYTVFNTTGHTRTFLITNDELLQMGYHPRKSVIARSNVILDGALSLARESEEDTFTGLLAKFDLLVTQEYEVTKIAHKGPNKGETITTPVTKDLVKGSITLYGTPEGNLAINTTGNLSKKFIADFRKKLRIELKNPVEFFEIALEDIHIPYRAKVTIGQEYDIKTQITSSITTRGNGTGAEVIFGPSQPKLAEIQQTQVVPEPATFVLLGFGGLIVMGNKNRVIRRLRRK